MINQSLIKKAKEISYAEADKHGKPSRFHIDFTNEKGQRLGELLGRNKNVILLGTLLMDCMLGRALAENRQSEHIKMSVEKAEEVLSGFPELEEKEKENIIYCVIQHHGAEKFYSPEAEICCNANCYKFASIKGFLCAVECNKDTDIKKRVDFLSQKADEKWNALTFDVCKKELESQYIAIKDFLSKYKD